MTLHVRCNCGCGLVLPVTRNNGVLSVSPPFIPPDELTQDEVEMVTPHLLTLSCCGEVLRDYTPAGVTVGV